MGYLQGRTVYTVFLFTFISDISRRLYPLLPRRWTYIPQLRRRLLDRRVAVAQVLATSLPSTVYNALQGQALELLTLRSHIRFSLHILLRCLLG